MILNQTISEKPEELEMKRFFYVIENGKREYFKGFNKDKGVMEFTPSIEEARFFTHTSVMKPRIGERIVKIAINVHSQNVEFCE